MSRLFEGLSRATMQHTPLRAVPPGMVTDGLSDPTTVELHGDGDSMPASYGSRVSEPQKVLEIEKARQVMVQCSPKSRLVAWTDPNSLGAEKFRALAVRLDDMRRQHELNSLAGDQ